MIVESHEKGEKIAGILKKTQPKDEDWDVVASLGHVLDLNTDKKGKYGSLGIDKTNLDMDYVPSKKGAKIISDLKYKIKNNNYKRVIIATDPDREGEGIAEHLRIRLSLGQNYERCTFIEITEKAIRKAVSETRKIDECMIKSQDARRIVDRVVGWEGTTAASKVLGVKTPIGRVQSKVIDFVVERELLRESFVEVSHFGLDCDIDNWKAVLDAGASGLVREGDKHWIDGDEAKSFANQIKKLKVTSMENSVVSEIAPLPFETLTMQQAAFNKLRFNSKKCDKIAQALYQAGHITYIRTDSTVLSDDGYEAIKQYSKDKDLDLPVVAVKRVGENGIVAQEAHECIRPSDFSFDSSKLSKDERALYELIKLRCIASQLEAAEYDKTELVLAVDLDSAGEPLDNKYDKLESLVFKASGRVMKYKGWRVLLDGDDSTETEEDELEDGDSGNAVPSIDEGVVVDVKECSVKARKTKPLPRYTEATLKQKLKKYGIGRPATYTSIFDKIGEGQHGYVLEEGTKKTPTLAPSAHARGMVAATKNYLSILDADYTKDMEGCLDEIAKGEKDRDSFVFDFFKTLDGELLKMLESEGVKMPTYKKCLKCGEEKLRSYDRKDGSGSFWGCTNEECKVTYNDENGEPVDKMSAFLNADGTPKFPCPNCKEPLIRILAKKDKKPWWICSTGRAVCEYITGEKKDGDEAPDFEAQKQREAWFKMVEDAKNADGTPKFPCPKCEKPLIKHEKRNQEGEFYFKCSARKKDCSYTCSVGADDKPEHKEG